MLRIGAACRSLECEAPRVNLLYAKFLVWRSVQIQFQIRYLVNYVRIDEKETAAVLPDMGVSRKGLVSAPFGIFKVV